MHCASVSFAPLLVSMCFFFKADMSRNLFLCELRVRTSFVSPLCRLLHLPFGFAQIPRFYFVNLLSFTAHISIVLFLFELGVQLFWKSSFPFFEEQ